MLNQQSSQSINTFFILRLISSHPGTFFILQLHQQSSQDMGKNFFQKNITFFKGGNFAIFGFENWRFHLEIRKKFLEKYKKLFGFGTGKFHPKI